MEKPLRDKTLDHYIRIIHLVASDCGFDPDNMTPAGWHAACDLTRTALALQNADVSDEQLGGFGDIFKEFNAAIRKLSEAVDTIAEVYDHVSAESIADEPIRR